MPSTANNFQRRPRPSVLNGLSGTFAGRYSIERELGRGGTALVYLARDLQTGKLVAIKVLRPQLAETVSADLFLREIRHMAAFDHPRIAEILDSGIEGRLLFCVLPYMEGGTLRGRIVREKQLRIDEVVALGRAMCDALEYAHSRNLIHRDVKPENIMYTGGEVKLADFGIARAMVRASGATRISGDLTTGRGMVRGSPAYMSPEQARGERELDGRSDVYSLACVLYEAIGGVEPFTGATAQQVISQRFQRMPRPLHFHRPTVSRDLEDVLQRAFAVAPANRYRTAKAFGEALAEVEPLTYDRPSSREARAGEAKESWLARWGLGTAAGVAMVRRLVRVL